MAYDVKNSPLMSFGTLAGSSMASTGIPSSSNSYVAVQNCRVTRIAFYVSIVMNSSTDIVLQIIQSTVLGSVSTQTTVGTLTIPKTQAINKIIYKDITPVNLNIGDQLLMNVTTAATSSGSGFFFVEADYDPETPLNQTKMIASA